MAKPAGAPSDTFAETPAAVRVLDALEIGNPNLPANQVFVVSEDRRHYFIAMLGPKSPKAPIAPEYESVERELRRPVPVWRGPGDLTLEFGSLYFDAFPDGSVEGLWREIEIMAGTFVGGDPEPLPLVVFGKSVPHDASQAPQNRWRIAAVEEDEDETIRRRDGKRCRIWFSLTLALVVEPKALERIAPRKPAPDFKVTKARRGDTYLKIAARLWGNQRLGRKLAQLNDDRDPSKRLTEGRQVRLPSAQLLAKWRKELR